jgi:hypothetical protein
LVFSTKVWSKGIREAPPRTVQARRNVSDDRNGFQARASLKLKASIRRYAIGLFNNKTVEGAYAARAPINRLWASSTRFGALRTGKIKSNLSAA